MKAKSIKKVVFILLAALVMICSAAASSFAAAADGHVWEVAQSYVSQVTVYCTAPEHANDADACIWPESNLQMIAPIKFTDAENREYDGDTHSVKLSGTEQYRGCVGLDFSDVTYEYDGERIDTLPKEVGVYKVFATVSVGTSPFDLFAYPIVKEFEISPKKITTSWEGDTFVYDGEEQGPEMIVETTDPFIEGEEVNPAIEYEDEEGNISDEKPVKAGQYTARVVFSGKDAGNYKCTEPKFDFTIEQKDITLEWDEEEKYVYNKEPQYPTFTYDGVIPGDDCSVTSVILDEDGNEVAEPTNAGTYTIKISLEGEDAGNYKLTEEEHEFEIEKKPVEIVWDGDQFTYNGEMQVPEVTFTDPEDEEIVDISFATADGRIMSSPTDADSYKAIATLKDTDNYAWADGVEPEFDFVIDPMEIPVQWGDEKTFEYNGQEHAPTVSIVPNYVVRGDDVDVTASTEKTVGTHTSTATLTGSRKTNYVLKEDTATCEFEITAKAVTIIWSNTELVYNGQEQFPTASVNQHDLVPGETCDVLTVEAYSDEACLQGATSKDVDAYYAKAVELSNDNYVLKEPEEGEEATYITPFTIVPFALSVKFSDNSFDYDGEEHLPTAELQTPFNGDDVEPVITVSGQKATDKDGTLVAIHAGTYTAAVDGATGLTGDASKNYTLKKDKYTYQFKINPKRVTITWFRPANDEYGDLIEGADPVEVPEGEIPRLVFNGKKQAPLAKVTAADLVGEDTCGVTITAPSDAIEVGEYEAQKINLSNPDYTADDSGTTYEIVPRPVKLAWDNKEAVYNGEKQERSVEITNLQKNSRNADWPCEVSVVKYTDGKHFGTDGVDGDEPEYNQEEPQLGGGTDITEDRTPIDAGTYTMTASELSDPYNYSLYILDPETNLPAEENVAQYEPIYTIHQYKIQKIDWSKYEVLYNASNQLPAAKVGDLQGPDTDKDCSLILTNEEGALDYKGECNAGNGYKVYILDKKGERSMNYIFDSEKMKEENYGWHKFIIKKRPLIITAKAKTITYGGKPSNNGVTYTGLVNGNVNKDKTSDGKPASGVVKGKITYTYTYTQYGKYGTYKIVPGKAGQVTSDNYTIQFKTGTLKVKDKVVKLVAKITSKGKKAAKLKWNKVTGAKKYVIYFSRCNHDNDTIKPKKFKTVKASKTSYVKKKLKKGMKYKFYIVALDKSGKKIAESKQGHVVVGNDNGTYTNPKKLTVTKKTVNLKVGKTYKIKSSVKKIKKGRKLLPKGHADKVRYMSYHPAVATVSKGGTIKAKAKGFCRVYVQAVNGMWQIIDVYVK